MKSLPARQRVEMFRLAYIVTHPIQYQAPLLRLLAQSDDIELQVFFLSDFSLHAHREEAFGQTVKWDVPLTDGYQWEVVPRVGLGPSTPLRPRWPVSGLRARLAAGKFDAVWVHGWGHIGLRQAIRAASALGLLVLLRGESTLDPGPVTWKRRLRDAYARRLLRRVAGCLCIGSWNREFYQSFGVPQDRLFSVPYAVDNAWFQARCAEAAPRREAFRRELGPEPGRPVILFAAKFIPVKAPEILLQAYQEAWNAERGAPNGNRKSDRGVRPYLLFVGDGPMRGQLEAQAGALLGGDVRFLGFRNQTELPALYDLCNLFVLPSRFEPWGLVVNEVMNAGRPVLVSDRVGAGPDLVRGGETGWVFPANDVAALAAALHDACADPARLARMGKAARERINCWSFTEDRAGILSALEAVTVKPVTHGV